MSNGDSEAALRQALRDVAILDRSGETDAGHILYPFALEELLCRQVGIVGTPIIHIWRHPGALVMGLRDSRLPGAKAVQEELTRSGIMVAVRNSGGAAVPLDAGVVNVTLIIPKPVGKLNASDDFEHMYRLIAHAVGDSVPLAKGEIIGSYCPGDYDLSIGGLKFCGIAQRRQTKAIAVQAFVVVEGSGRRHGEIAQYFYSRAAGGVSGLDYPSVVPAQMASLSELCGILRVETFVANVKKAAEQLSGASAGTSSIELPSEEEISVMIDQLRTRYGI